MRNPRRLVGPALMTTVVVLIAGGCASRAVSMREAVPPGSAPVAAAATAKRHVIPVRKKVVPTPKDAALALSRRMVDQAVLPGGAVRTSAPLPSELRGPWQEPASGNLVSANRVWNVAMDPDAVVSFLKEHAPAGFVESGVGTLSSRTTRVTYVVDALGTRPPNVSLAGIEIGVETHGAGSLVNVVGGVQWTQVRPAGEHVGTRDGAVVISEVPYANPSTGHAVRRVVVTGAPRSAIVSAFNALAVAPPFTGGGCFELGMDAVSYRVAFATSPTARPDVVATIAPCSPVAVRLVGHASVSLTTSGAFLDAVAHALGVSRLTYSPSPAPG